MIFMDDRIDVGVSVKVIPDHSIKTFVVGKKMHKVCIVPSRKDLLVLTLQCPHALSNT